MTIEPTCPACGNKLSDHMGVIGLCAARNILCDLVNKYRIALADAIRRPMGVVPDSALGLITADELRAAEDRRETI